MFQTAKTSKVRTTSTSSAMHGLTRTSNAGAPRCAYVSWFGSRSTNRAGSSATQRFLRILVALTCLRVLSWAAHGTFQGGACPVAPNHLFSIRGASGGTTRGSDSIGNGNDNGALASSFLLQWSTGVSSFTLRSRRCIESIMCAPVPAELSTQARKLSTQSQVPPPQRHRACF